VPEVSAAAVPADLSSPRTRFTFRGNLATSRHGWLRLTPAYSVHLVRELLESVDPSRGPVLDPFCGTGTTLLACGERGLSAETIDLNPFLVWLARAKTARYDGPRLDEAKALVRRMERRAAAASGDAFVPDIHRVERWWDPTTLGALGRAAAELRRDEGDRRSRDLASLAFCRALIATANVSFGHQSMSFRAAAAPSENGGLQVQRALRDAIAVLAEGASTPLRRASLRVHSGDSRAVDRVVSTTRFGTIVTSPPYSNRMSYIRELRPYMYWLGHLVARRDAGELDWRAIGGTWGAATSRLATWKADPERHIPFPGFSRIVSGISEREPILGRYVHRYFEDMLGHVRSLVPALASEARVHYVVGNSKFYDVLLPAEEIFAALFEASGFSDARITRIRKRTSKRELFEFLVEATFRPDAKRRGSTRSRARTARA
jgi:hypothetical protein